MPWAIISDVHLGSRYCHFGEFLGFVRSLPAGVNLVLNGDIVNHRHRLLLPKHQEGIELLRDESLRRRVVWIRGNNERDYKPDDPGYIEFVNDFAIGKRLYIAHGHQFETIMRQCRPLLILIRRIHGALTALLRRPAHVAAFAKRWPHLYKILLDQVAGRAVAYARANGYESVTCGHTHHPEERAVEGIRYLNTGAWTEMPVHYVWLSDDELGLRSLSERSASSASAP